MRTKDFVIQGIPSGYRVYDVDLTPSGESVVVLGHDADKSQPVVVRWSGAEIRLPDNSLWHNDYHNKLLLSPMVRAIGEERVLVATSSAESDTQINARVWGRSGEVEAAFHTGDGVDEVVASRDFILVFYTDQGQHDGRSSLSGEAMSVMSASGDILWGHRSQFGNEGGFYTSFHAAVWDGGDRVAVFADVNVGCAFVRLDIRTRRQELWHPPTPIASPGAVTTIDERVLVHGAGMDDESEKFLRSFPGDLRAQEMVNSGVKRHHIVEWLPGDDEWEVVGEWPWEQTKSLTGLPGGRFLQVNSSGYTIISFE